MIGVYEATVEDAALDWLREDRLVGRPTAPTSARARMPRNATTTPRHSFPAVCGAPSNGSIPICPPRYKATPAEP